MVRVELVIILVICQPHHNTMNILSRRSLPCRIARRRFSSRPPRPVYAELLTKISRLRAPSPIRALQPLLKIPDMISLGGGYANAVQLPLLNPSSHVVAFFAIYIYIY